MKTSIKFNELLIGDTFDFIADDGSASSFYDRCQKVSKRCYVVLEGTLKGNRLEAGSIHCHVYHAKCRTDATRFDSVARGGATLKAWLTPEQEHAMFDNND